MPNIDDIMDWESGNMDEEREVKMFQSMVDDGSAWQLQGMYGRRAMDLINAGLVHRPASKAGAAYIKWQGGE